MKVKDFAPYPDNPFTPQGISRKLIMAKPKYDEMVNNDTGELVQFRAKSGEYEVLRDSMKYVKLATGSAGIIADLGIRGVSLFAYIMENLKPGKSVIKLNRTEVVKSSRYANLKGGGYYMGIIDLLQHGVIARGAKVNEYWINSNIVFNGDRTKIVKDETNQG